MRQVMGKRMGPDRGRGVPAVRRNRQITVAVAAYSGEGFRQPGGTDWRGIRGESERRGRTICRRGGSSVRAGSKEN
jgi:hypothetical protein